MPYRNHLGTGSVTIAHKDKNISTTLGSNEFERFITTMDQFDYINGNIPPGFEHRADLISNLFYNTPTLDWLICWFNGVSDPFQQLNILDSIRIPKLV